MELMGEVDDVQAHCGWIWITEADMIVITELNECLCLLGMISGGACEEGLGSKLLSRLLEVVVGQVVFWNEIKCHQIK